MPSLFHVKLSCLSSVYNCASLFFFSPHLRFHRIWLCFDSPHRICISRRCALIGATATETSTCSFYISKYGGLCPLHSLRCAWREVEPKLFFAQSNFQRWAWKKKKKRKRTRISDSLLINWSKTRSNQKLPHVQSVCITLVEDCCNMHAENFKWSMPLYRPQSIAESMDLVS